MKVLHVLPLPFLCTGLLDTNIAHTCRVVTMHIHLIHTLTHSCTTVAHYLHKCLLGSLFNLRSENWLTPMFSAMYSTQLHVYCRPKWQVRHQVPCCISVPVIIGSCQLTVNIKVWSTDRPTDQPTNRQTNWLDRLTDWLTNQLTGSPTDGTIKLQGSAYTTNSPYDSPHNAHCLIIIYDTKLSQ